LPSMDSVFFSVNNSPGTSDTFRTALRESTGPVATGGVWGIEWVCGGVWGIEWVGGGVWGIECVVVVVVCGGLSEWVSG
jgi:hypothetical protein